METKFDGEFNVPEQCKQRLQDLSRDNMELGQPWVGVRENLQFAFSIQDWSLWDRASGIPALRGIVMKKPRCPVRPASDSTAAPPAPGFPQHFRLVPAQRKEPPRNTMAELLRFGALNVHSPSSFLVKFVQAEIS